MNSAVKKGRKKTFFSVIGGIFLLLPLVLVSIVGYFLWNGFPLEGSRPPWKVRSALNKVGTEQLKKDVRFLAQKLGTTNLREPAPGLEETMVIPKEVWPISFQTFAPLRAQLYYDRISLVTSDSGSFHAEVEVFYTNRAKSFGHDEEKTPDNSFIGGGSHESEYKICKGVHWLTTRPFLGVSK